MIETVAFADACNDKFRKILLHNIYGDSVTAIYLMTSVFILVTNAILVFALWNLHYRRSFTRNERLVLLLSFSDILIALVQLPLLFITHFFPQQSHCWMRYLSAFWNVFPVMFSAMIIILIGVERLTSTLDGHVCCMSKQRLLPYCLLCGLISLMWALPHAYISTEIRVLKAPVDIEVISTTHTYNKSLISRQNLRAHGVYFLSLATFQGMCIVLMIIVNYYMVKNAQRSIKNCSIRRNVNINIGKRLSQTVCFISLVLCITYTPTVFTSLFTAIYMLNGNILKLQSAYISLVWFRLLTFINSGLNALVYITRNKSIVKFYRLCCKDPLSKESIRRSRLFSMKSSTTFTVVTSKSLKENPINHQSTSKEF